jgi:hypothetical protein
MAMISGSASVDSLSVMSENILANFRSNWALFMEPGKLGAKAHSSWGM